MKNKHMWYILEQHFKEIVWKSLIFIKLSFGKDLLFLVIQIHEHVK